MPQFTVGCVPYVNAIPLVWHFEKLGKESPVKVIYDIPSKLPELLDSNQAQAILVSSIDAIRTPNRTIANGVCIGSNGPVESVRLFSRVPFGLIQTLALDASSMTSNRLAQIILQENYGSRPQTLAMPPDIEKMLDVCDACVLIGDNGMTAQYPGTRVLDLGEAWTDTTGLPFVWAYWTGTQNSLNPTLVNHLNQAYQETLTEQKTFKPEVIQYAAQKANWTEQTTSAYLHNCIRFPLDASAHKGLQTYKQKLISTHLIPEAFPAQIISPTASSLT